MAGRTLQFHFDFGSPIACLAATQVQRIADKNGANLVWRPKRCLEPCRHPALGRADALLSGQDRLDAMREALTAA